jgi:uncharacterized protein (DUF488 family)
MELFTIGFTRKSARHFFELIKRNAVQTLIDIRLWNSTQLSGFAKGRDLAYFLSELCGCGYEHHLEFAPTAELLDAYRQGKLNWTEYEKEYDYIISERGGIDDFYKAFREQKVCLLCSEETPERCHRRLLAERIAKQYPEVYISHLI